MLQNIFTREAGATFSKKNAGVIRQTLHLLATALRDAGISLDDDETDTTDKKPAVTKESARNNRAIIEAAGFSMADVATLIDTAIRAGLPSGTEYDRMPQVCDIYDDYFVYREGWRGAFYRVPYALTETGDVSLGTPSLVVRKVQYVAPSNTANVSESDVQTPIEIIGDDIDLCERAVNPDGTTRIKLIAPGVGSSGYYSPELLKRDGPKVFKRGVQMFWDHPTIAEERDRPEGSLNKLAAILETDAAYDENGPRGAGLYARANVRSSFRADVDELAPHIGVSIRAAGKAHIGDMNGKRMPIIDEITEARSVDFVTRAGADGAIIQMFESAGRKRDIEPAASQLERDTTMPLSDDDRKAIADMISAGIREATAPLSAALAATRDAADLREAGAAVDRYLSTINGLPRVVRERITPQIAASFTRTDTGAIDIAALVETARVRAVDEMRYLRESGARLAMPAGFGESAPANTANANANGGADDDVTSIFASWGLSESAAKIAAAGRVIN